MLAFDFSVTCEAYFFAEDGALEPINEEGEGLDLFAGGALDFEVTDEADSDSNEVEGMVFDVPAL